MDPMGYVQQPYEAKETNDGPNQRPKNLAFPIDIAKAIRNINRLQ